MDSFEDLDAQLEQLQAQLKNDIQKTKTTASDFDWPSAPDFDFEVQTQSITPSKTVAEPPLPAPPTVEELEQVVSQAPKSPYDNQKPVEINFASKPTNQNPPKSSNPAAEKQVDELTSALMTNLENGTASDGPVATVKAESLGNCHKCNLPIEGYDSACSGMNLKSGCDLRGCEAMGYNFHIKCLVCLKCNKNLHGGEFIVMNTDDPYCQSCYEASLEKCCECGETIKTRILRAAGKIYHPECFKCTNCKCILDGVPFTQDSEKRAYCIACYQELHSPKCFKCGKPICPEPGEKEALRIIAMDKSFHKACFVCEKCNISLTDSKAGGCYPVNDKFFCKQCSMAEINEQMKRT